MFLKNLSILDFRNIEKINIELNTNFNIFWGNNAQGKTNILESIYLLANLKSFRNAKNINFIKHDKFESAINCSLSLQNVDHSIQLKITKNKKQALIDGKELNKIEEYLGRIQPILFSPEELNIVKGLPSGRRSLLDRAIFQTDINYLKKYLYFNNFLKQRNIILKNKNGDLDLWTEGFIKSGAKIRNERFKYIKRISNLFKDCFSELTGGTEEADIIYPVKATSEEEFQEILRSELIKDFEKEKKYQQTLSGPHRDDPEFLINGYPLRMFGSQGQQRSFILAFKTAQIIDMENIIGSAPILLLDDMTSELDWNRQRYFFSFLEKQNAQVFITTTDIETIKKEKLNNPSYFHVNKGEIISEARG